MHVQLATFNHQICQPGLLEIDHIFIGLSTLPSASWLQEAGLTCVQPILSHADRGTVSQVIFFETTYLEFIQVVDQEVAEQFALKTGIDFVKRSNWQQSGASPFGIALRHKPVERPCFRSRRLPRIFAVDQVDDLQLRFSGENLLAQADPLCFVVPEGVSLTSLIDCNSDHYRRKVCHPLGMELITQAVIRMKHRARSQPIQFLEETGILTLAPAASPLLELTFDQHQQNKVLDFQPIGVPLMLKF